MAFALVLLTAILRGSDEICECLFRVLRWIAGRPEPPAPGRHHQVAGPIRPEIMAVRIGTVYVLVRRALHVGRTRPPFVQLCESHKPR